MTLLQIGGRKTNHILEHKDGIRLNSNIAKQGCSRLIQSSANKTSNPLSRSFLALEGLQKVILGKIEDMEICSCRDSGAMVAMVYSGKESEKVGK